MFHILAISGIFRDLDKHAKHISKIYLLVKLYIYICIYIYSVWRKIEKKNVIQK